MATKQPIKLDKDTKYIHLSVNKVCVSDNKFLRIGWCEGKFIQADRVDIHDRLFPRLLITLAGVKQAFKVSDYDFWLYIFTY